MPDIRYIMHKLRSLHKKSRKLFEYYSRNSGRYAYYINV